MSVPLYFPLPREQTGFCRDIPQGGRAPGVRHAECSSQDVARKEGVIMPLALARPAGWAMLQASIFLQLLFSKDWVLTAISCRKGLPVDLSEGVLKATCMQALGQVTTTFFFFLLLSDSNYLESQTEVTWFIMHGASKISCSWDVGFSVSSSIMLSMSVLVCQAIDVQLGWQLTVQRLPWLSKGGWHVRWLSAGSR